MRSYYTGKHAQQYNQTWKAFSQKTLEEVLAAIDVAALRASSHIRQSELTILDAGCGTGLLLERFAHLFPSAHLYGIDASEDMLKEGRQRLQSYSNVHLHCAELSRGTTAGLPYPPAFFNLITCTNTLHYLQEPVEVLKGFNTLLVEQGQFVLEDYVLRGFPFLWKALEWGIRLYDPGHRFLLSQEQAQHLCQQAGFHVVRAQTFPIDRFCQGWTVCAIPQHLLS